MSHGPERFSISSSRITSADPDSVMARVVRPETWSEWVPEIVAMDSSGELAAGDEAEGLAEMLGFRVDGRARVTEATPVRLVQDVVIGVRMIARYEVEATPRGTRVTHELVVTSPEGAMGRLLAFLLRGRLKAMQKRLLANLVRLSELDPALTADEPRAAGT